MPISNPCSTKLLGENETVRAQLELPRTRPKPHGGSDVPDNTCSVEGCVKPARSGRSPYCEAHYYRVRRTGSVGTERIGRYVRGGTQCDFAGCVARAVSKGLCSRHYARLTRHGDPSIVAYASAKGPDNPFWKGDDASYRALHRRVRVALGPARFYECSCGAWAAHWSYDHCDPAERRSELGPYSFDVFNHYDPLCVRCHKRRDLDYLAGR